MFIFVPQEMMLSQRIQAILKKPETGRKMTLKATLATALGVNYYIYEIMLPI